MTKTHLGLVGLYLKIKLFECYQRRIVMVRNCVLGIFFALLFSPSVFALNFGLDDVVDPLDLADHLPGLNGIVDGVICGLEMECNPAQEIVEQCILGFNARACATAIHHPNFRFDCHLIGELAENYLDFGVSGGLGDLVGERGLYDEIKAIYDVGLNTPGFSDFVRNRVKHVWFKYSLGDSAARADGTTIYYRKPENIPAGKTGKEQISNALIMHEIFHMWQFYREGMRRFTNTYCDEVIREYSLPTYNFNLDTKRNVFEYGVEQQAAILEMYYLIKYKGETNCNNLQDFTNCSDFNPWEANYKKEATIRAFETVLGFSIMPTQTLHESLVEKTFSNVMRGSWPYGFGTSNYSRSYETGYKTAALICKDKGYLSGRITSTSSSFGGHYYASEGQWKYVYENSPLVKINSVTCVGLPHDDDESNLPSQPSPTPSPSQPKWVNKGIENVYSSQIGGSSVPSGACSVGQKYYRNLGYIANGLYRAEKYVCE